MVETMTTVYKALSAEEQSEVYMQAVGQSVFSSSNSEFCQGSFGMCSDTDGNPWWNEWNSAQRDVYFFYRSDVDDNDWKYYCTYSMNSYESEFGNTIDELLVLIDQPPLPTMSPSASPSSSPTATMSPTGTLSPTTTLSSTASTTMSSRCPVVMALAGVVATVSIML
mmetsp:Transcript_17857/g.21404  ORF Transcript_17857/g.21404 Transcript_17857/m.21404 type:complete len:167 (-) Transcript_17857:233-733(-)